MSNGLTISVSSLDYDIDVELAGTVLFDIDLLEGEGLITALGTPVANQVAVFNSAAVIRGHSTLVYDGTSLNTPFVKVDHIAEYTLNHGIVLDHQTQLNDQKNVGTFISGFAGQGHNLKYEGGLSSLTLDNLTVRRKLNVYELEIREVSHVGGAVLVSVANGKVISFTGTGPYNLYFDTDGGSNAITFQVNDYVRAQAWTGRDLGYFQGQITYIGSNYITVTSTDTPWNNMSLVQVGHPTNAARQNMIYITASDTNNPYIDGLAGVTDGVFTGHNVFRLGNLAGITDADFGGALTGYGLYSNNIYLTGAIKATSGLIGGFTINATEGLYSGTGASRVQMKPGAGMWAGATAIGDAPFSVTNAGLLKAASGTIGGWTLDTDAVYTGTKHTTDGYSSSGITLASTGSIHAPKFYLNSNGDIGLTGLITLDYAVDGSGFGIKTEGTNIWEDKYNGSNSSVLINYKGYQGGTSFYRSTIIGDGKGANILACAVAGTQPSVTVTGFLKIDFNATPYGLVLSAMNTAGRNAISTFNGLVIFNSQLNRIEYYVTGIGWLYLTGTAV